jgi:valyl-tRNA synthetase
MGRNFSNKIWNAYRFLALNLDQPHDDYQNYKQHYQLADHWILSRLQTTINEVGKNLDNFRLNDSITTVYHFFWHEYCDWYLELIKPRLSEEADPEQKKTVRVIAVHVMKTCMGLLHSYIPFISEEIWQRLKNEDEDSLVIAAWPKARKELVDSGVEHDMQFVQNVIVAIRNIRSEMNVPPGSKAELVVKSDDRQRLALLNKQSEYLNRLARIKSIREVPHSETVTGAAMAVVENIELFIPLAGLIDLTVERNRLQKEIDRLVNQVNGLNKKLLNKQFLEKAPENVVNQEKEKLRDFSEKLSKLNKNLEQLN